MGGFFNSLIEHVISKTYENYIFLLVTSPEWAASSSALDLQRLRDAFVGFGRQIGRDNLAVFFYDKDRPIPDTATAARFAKLLDLDLSKGPYLVYVTPKHPGTLGIVIEEVSGRINKRIPADILYNQVKEDLNATRIVVDLNRTTLTCTVTLLNDIQANLYWKKDARRDIEGWQGKDNCDSRKASEKLADVFQNWGCIVLENIRSIEVEGGIKQGTIKVKLDFGSFTEARNSCGSPRSLGKLQQKKKS